VAPTEAYILFLSSPCVYLAPLWRYGASKVQR